VLFIEPKAVDFADAAVEHDVRLVPVRTIWKEAAAASLPVKSAFFALLEATRRFGRSGDGLYRTLAQLWLHPHAGRHHFYLDYLLANPQYRRVMTTDSKDVLFQANPFDRLDDLGGDDVLHAFCQADHFTFRDGDTDTRWIRELYGEPTLAKLRDRPTLCAGTTMGGRTAFLAYLEAMVAESLQHRRLPLDQAMHNKILHLDWAGHPPRLHRNAEAIVYTMFGIDDAEYTIGDDATVTLGDAVPAVLHQYNHIRPVHAALHAKWSAAAAGGRGGG
jgi:hypothetical protein